MLIKYLFIVPGPLSSSSVEYDRNAIQLIISWNPPSEPNGILKGYNISIRTMEASPTLFQTIISADSKSYIYNLTVLCRNYTARIYAFTSIGPGPSTNFKFVATAPGFDFPLFNYFPYISLYILGTLNNIWIFPVIIYCILFIKWEILRKMYHLNEGKIQRIAPSLFIGNLQMAQNATFNIVHQFTWSTSTAMIPQWTLQLMFQV